MLPCTFAPAGLMQATYVLVLLVMVKRRVGDGNELMGKEIRGGEYERGWRLKCCSRVLDIG